MKQRRIIITGILGFILIILIGIGGLGFWGWSMFVDQAEDAIQNNFIVQKYIGEVNKIKVDLIATGQADGTDDFVFRIEGSKGSGVISAEFVTVGENTEEICSGTLQLSSGETYDLLD